MKNKFLIAIFFSVFLLIVPDVQATTFKDNQMVDPNKTWTIKFSNQIEFDDLIKEGIIVKDSKGKKVNVQIKLGEDGKTIIINAPVGGYVAREKYKLNINEKVHSKKGKNIKKSINLFFSIKGTLEFDIEKLVDNGEDYNKLVLVMLGDGYTVSELPKFKKDASKLINYMLNQEPFNKYKKDINVYSINVISNVSGASSSPDNIKDTYFGSCFNFAYNIQRLIAPTKSEKVYNCLKNSNIDYDLGVVIVNSDIYGGSGGRICVTTTNEYSKEIFMHELGHSFGDLRDEYFAGDKYTTEAANLTRESNPNLVRWKSFIGKNNIGVYPMEGTTGWYIPHQECKMKVLEAPFCDVCKDALEKKIIEETRKLPKRN
ncbi:M64 family metallopeptidase [Clostridium novyi]|uniref:M64 family metallopeptidase n=1 Tax=Clostridium novyi TaxID=1542 RepID=UPI00068B7CDC|nr:M64 family metallopeptidase [Clostridium novyi]